MGADEKKELLEKLSNLSISEKLDLLTDKSIPVLIKKQIKLFICENYERNSQYEFLESLKDLDKMNLVSEIKTRVILSKTCARDIISKS